MATGRIDLVIANVPAGNVILTYGCSEGRSELAVIPESQPLVLKNGKATQNVTLSKLESRECVADYLEIHSAAIRKLGLKPYGRYEANYSSSNHTLTLAWSPVSLSNGYLLPSTKIGTGTVSIGYDLLARLGIPERRGYPLRLHRGKRTAMFRLHVPSNLDDNRIWIAPNWMKPFQLYAGHSYPLRYDQRTSTLSVGLSTGGNNRF